MLCALLVGFSSLPSIGRAQETPADAAARQEAEERYKRMSADIEDLKAALQSYQQRLSEQRDEIRKLSEELARAANNKDLATREDLKHLAEKIKEVDDKRIADNENVMKQFTRLGQTLTAPPKVTPAGPTPNVIKPAPDSVKLTTEKGLEYVVRSGDNPKVISVTLAKQGVKVTQKQIIEANPTVVWNKLKIGQKIFIPAQLPP